VVKDGETTSLPIVATDGADGACKYAADRHRSTANSDSASVAPDFTQTVCEHPVRISNAGANSRRTLMRLGYLIFIGRLLLCAVQQTIDVER
jgi:hypothetical protein